MYEIMQGAATKNPAREKRPGSWCGARQLLSAFCSVFCTSLFESFRLLCSFVPSVSHFQQNFSVIDIHRARHPPTVRSVLVVGLGVLHGDLLNLPSRSTTPGAGVLFVLHGFVM